jgi:hypothetical protein
MPALQGRHLFAINQTMPAKKDFLRRSLVPGWGARKGEVLVDGGPPHAGLGWGNVLARSPTAPGAILPQAGDRAAQSAAADQPLKFLSPATPAQRAWAWRGSMLIARPAIRLRSICWPCRTTWRFLQLRIGCGAPNTAPGRPKAALTGLRIGPKGVMARNVSSPDWAFRGTFRLDPCHPPFAIPHF